MGVGDVEMIKNGIEINCIIVDGLYKYYYLDQSRNIDGYYSIAEIRELNGFTFTDNPLIKRLNRGESVKDAITKIRSAQVKYSNNQTKGTQQARRFEYPDNSNTFYLISEILAMPGNEDIHRRTLEKRLSNKINNLSAEQAILAIRKAKALRPQNGLKGKIAAANGIQRSTLSTRSYKDMPPEEAVPLIKANQPTKHPYITEAGEIIQITIGKAADISGVDPTSIRRYVKAGYTLNEAIVTLKGISRPLLATSQLTSGELNKDNLALNSEIQKRLKKFCIAHKINYRAISYLIQERNFSINEAVLHYQENGHPSTNNWKYIINDILLESFTTKYLLDGKGLRTYLKENNYDLGRALEKTVFLCIDYTDFDVTPRIRKDLLEIYHHLQAVPERERYDALVTSVTKPENGVSLASKLFDYLLKKYGFINMLKHYYHLNPDVEDIDAQMMRKYVTESLINFFEQKYSKLAIIKQELEFLYFRALYINTNNKDELLDQYQINQAHLSYILGIDNDFGSKLYDGYQLIETRRMAEGAEVQLNEPGLIKKLSYSDRFYY